jgi:polar amino acid transport system ATP-binding protein
MVGEVLQAMRRLAGSGMTVICVTHEMGFAREVADQAWFIEKGVVAERGAPAQMFDAPRSPRLQAFLRREGRRLKALILRSAA